MSKQIFLQTAVLSFKERFGIELSIDTMETIIGSAMDREWKAFPYTVVSQYMDTAPCEEIADLVAFHYLKEYWPTGIDRVDFVDFYGRLKDAIEKESVDATV